MDFIKNLHISDIAGDKDKKHPSSSSDTTPAAPPPTAIHATHGQTADAKHAGGSTSSSIFDKIGDALKEVSEHKATTAPVATPAPVQAPASHTVKEDIFSKLGDALSGKKTPPPVAVTAPTPVAVAHKEGENLLSKLGDAHSGKKTPPPVAVAAPTPVAAGHKEGENLFSKLGDALSGKKTPPPPTPVPVAAAHKDENILHKLGDALSGKKTPPPAPVPVEKHQNIVDKLTEAVTGKKAEPVPVEKPSLVHSISNAVLGKEEKVVEKPHGLMDKLNHALGGGQKGEAEEDKLDKAIDLFQEHVLKEGPQNNESALEQAKDKHIADMIKSAVGKKDK